MFNATLTPCTVWELLVVCHDRGGHPTNLISSCLRRLAISIRLERRPAVGATAFSIHSMLGAGVSIGVAWVTHHRRKVSSGCRRGIQFSIGAGPESQQVGLMRAIESIKRQRSQHHSPQCPLRGTSSVPSCVSDATGTSGGAAPSGKATRARSGPREAPMHRFVLRINVSAEKIRPHCGARSSPCVLVGLRAWNTRSPAWQ